MDVELADLVDGGRIILSTDEQALADELGPVIAGTPVPENVEGRGDPQCAAEVWVAGLGLETLEEAGISVGNVDTTSLITMLSLGGPQEVESIQLTIGVLCARDLFVTSFMDQLGWNRPNAECLFDALLADPDLRRGFFDPRITDDPTYQQGFQEALTACS